MGVSSFIILYNEIFKSHRALEKNYNEVCMQWGYFLTEKRMRVSQRAHSTASKMVSNSCNIVFLPKLMEWTSGWKVITIIILFLFLIPSSQEFDRHKAVIYRKITELNVIAAIFRPLLVPKHKLWAWKQSRYLYSNCSFLWKVKCCCICKLQIREANTNVKDILKMKWQIFKQNLSDCENVFQLFKTLKAGGWMINMSIHNTEKGII